MQVNSVKNNLKARKPTRGMVCVGGAAEGIAYVNALGEDA